ALRRRRAAEGFEGEGGVLRGLKTLLGVFLETATDDAVHARRHRRAGFKLRRILFEDGAHRFDGTVALERGAAGEHLEEDEAKREDVRTMVRRFAAYLLRRHVGGRPHHS